MNRTNPSRDERSTPSEIIKSVKTIFGGAIEFDPCGMGRRPIADHTLTKRFDGLNAPWKVNGRTPRSVYVNPPGSLLLPFARRFVEEMNNGIRFGCFMIYNHDHTTKYWRALTETERLACIVLLPKRWRFRGPDGKLFEVGRSQTLLYYAGRERDRAFVTKRASMEHGDVWVLNR